MANEDSRTDQDAIRSRAGLLTSEMIARQMTGVRILLVRNQKTGGILPLSLIYGKDFSNFDSFMDEVDTVRAGYYDQNPIGESNGLYLENLWVQDMEDFQRNNSDLVPRLSLAERQQSDFMSVADPNLLKGRLLMEFMEKSSTDPEGLYLVSRALRRAENVHKNQLRKEGKRYIFHPLRVALDLYRDGFTDASSVCVGILHDVLEDSTLTAKDLEEEFGKLIADGVSALSKRTLGGEVGREEYFARLNLANPMIKTVKVYDRIDNVRSLRNLKDDVWKRDYIKETEKYVYPLAEDKPPLFEKLRQEVESVKVQKSN